MRSNIPYLVMYVLESHLYLCKLRVQYTLVSKHRTVLLKPQQTP